VCFKHDVVISSYVRYDGVRGSFGQYGTGMMEVETTDTSVFKERVAVKSFRPGKSGELKDELKVMRAVQGICIVPKVYGTAAVPLKLPTDSQPWGIVMQRVPISFDQWFRGSSKSCALNLPDSRLSPVHAVSFFTHFLSSASKGLKLLHKRGYTHRDIKPGNMGGVEKDDAKIPCTSNTDIRLIIFDYNLSTNLSWGAGSWPYSKRCYFKKDPSRSNKPSSVDYFQCLVVVMVYMVSVLDHSKFYRSTLFANGALELGRCWLSTKNIGWLAFFLSHTDCSEPFHTCFCKRAQDQFGHVMDTCSSEMFSYDTKFSFEIRD
jgi:serine/threonine protein kinase